MMNQRLTIIQLVVFVVITFGCGYYVVNNVLGARTFGDPIRVTVRMHEASGLSPGAAVTYRGVEIGTVTEVRIRAGGGGVTLKLSLNSSARVPVDSEAVVTVNSPIGIPHLDLRPRSNGGPYLNDSSTLRPADVTRPPPLEKLLVDFMRVVKGVSGEDIAALTTALSTALRGMEAELNRLLANGETLLKHADEWLRQLTDLTENAREFVDSGDAGGERIRVLAESVRELTDSLRKMEPSIRKLVKQVPEAAKTVARLLSDTRTSVGTLLGNLVSTSRVVSARIPALRQLLISLPKALRELAGIIRGDTAYFYLVATQGPACYYGTERRSPTETAPSKPQLGARCPANRPHLQQRGAANAPRPSAPAPPVPRRPVDSGEHTSGAQRPASQHTRTASRTEPTSSEGGNSGKKYILGPRPWSSILLRGAN